MGFGSVFKKVVSAPVKIAKTVAKPIVKGTEKIIDTGETIGKTTWKGVKSTGKALTSPEGASIAVTGTGVITGNPSLVATGLGSLSKNYIDEKRIGIQGWSYGGYMSSLAITKGADVFNLAVAVAPVTNWRYYDNIYTERYMQTPQENPSGYDENSPINHVEKLKGKYLLIHGTADDNVHVQNTYEMSSALVRANKQFDLFLYPDKNHGIYGKNTRYHLYKKITNFILDNL